MIKFGGIKMVKKIDLNIKSNDLDFTKEELEEKSVVDIVISNIENAIASSYSDDNNPKKSISNDQQRKIFRLMNSLESHKDGIAEISDTHWALLCNNWDNRKFPPVAGKIRKIHARIDELFFPDEYSEKADEVPKDNKEEEVKPDDGK